MTPVVIPEIETERLILRGPIPADVDVWASYVGDPDYLRYLPKRAVSPRERAEQTLNSITQVWEQQPLSDIAWVISQKASGEIMGWSAAGPSAGDNEIELVYMLGKPFWGRGFATEAARAVVRYGFENQPWERIVAAIIPGNVASRRVLEHLGFVYEKDVNYYETSGDTSIEMESPIVPSFALQRARFAPGAALYHVRSGGAR